MPRQYISFGEWLPDRPEKGLQGCVTALNVIPAEVSYLPFPSLVQFSTSLGSRCKGMILATDSANNNYNYAGDASALYTLTNQSFSISTRLVGGAYTIATDDFWEFVNWGSTVIGVNGLTDPLQQISLGAANFADLSVGVKAKHIAVMRDFVVLGNVSDSATNVTRIRWSAINNPASFTANAATLADFQDLPTEGGEIQKVLGGDYGVVLQRRSIWRMLFVGSPLVFQFDKIHSSIGLYAPQAAVRYQSQTFFLAEDGFYSFNGAELTPIGNGKVDNFFFTDLNTSNFQRINSLIDPVNKLVIWAYPSNSSIGGNPDKLIVYNWLFAKWALVEGVNIQFFTQSITTGYTLDGLDAVSTNLDTGILWSLDSVQWTGGQIIMSAFNATNQLSRFNGSAMAATIESGEFKIFEDNRAMITQVRPDIVGLSASATISIINRNNLTESASVGGAAAYPNATGFVSFRVDSRYFRVRLNTAANVEFTHIVGVEIEAVQTGRR